MEASILGVGADSSVVDREPIILPTTEEIIQQIDRTLNVYKEHRTRAEHDDLSDLHEGINAEVRAIVFGTMGATKQRYQIRHRNRAALRSYLWPQGGG